MPVQPVSLLDDLAATAEAVRRDRPQHPSGWEPGIAWDGKTGTITSRPLAEPTPDWDALLRVWGFDPAVVEVVEPVQVRTWDAQTPDGVRTMWYFRAGVRQRRASGPDLAALIAEIGKRKPRPVPVPTGDRAFVYIASDWQTGKPGTAAMVDRVLASYAAAAARLRMLRRMGTQIGPIYLLALGDLIEGCADHYPAQTFLTEYDKRTQVKLARRLWLKGVETFAPLTERLVCAAVPGNHGENRQNGRAYTTTGDNADIEVVEQAAEVIAAVPHFAHVSSVIPGDDLTLTLDIAGTVVGLAHGHQAKRGATPQQRVREWWKGQAFGMQPVGDATVLLTGHYHHLVLTEDGPRTHIQVPTMDSGSDWWVNATGMVSRPAAVTLTMGPTGWDDLKLV